MGWTRVMHARLRVSFDRDRNIRIASQAAQCTRIHTRGYRYACTCDSQD
jgi:hypothetical protein